MSPLLRVESGCRLVALKSPSTFSRLCRPRYVDARKIGVGRIERRPLAHHAVGPAKAVLRRIFAAASPPIGRDPQPSPHFSDEREGLGEGSVLSYVFAEARDQRPQSEFRHVGYQLVEHAALSEQ